MTRKSFAAIKSAQEMMAKIEELAAAVEHKPTTAYRTMKEIKALAAKWNADFQDCDPAWQPPQKAAAPSAARQNAIALGAFVQKG